MAYDSTSTRQHVQTETAQEPNGSSNSDSPSSSPSSAVLVAIVLLWNSAVDAADLGIMVVMYVLTAVGITVGFHRLLTHRAFQTYPWLERTFAVLGSLAVEGSVLDWVADHRKHHAFSDKDGDPHSPHVGHGTGLRGLWHAHAGWLLETQGQSDWKRYAPDLYEDPAMRKIGKRFPLLVLRHAVAPDGRRLRAHGFTLVGALEGYIWGGLVRIFIVHHVTWSINSLCHVFGRSASRSRTSRRTSRGSRCRRSASPGTTTTTPSRGPPTTG